MSEHNAEQNKGTGSIVTDMESGNSLANTSVDRGQFLLSILVVLALIASVIMLFTGDAGALKLALLAALWSAVIGFFLTIRYRGQVERSRLELERQRVEHDKQLEQAQKNLEVTQAHMERDIEKKLHDQETAALAQIKQQLAELKQQLEYLTGHSIVEPTMLRAKAQRIREIEKPEGAIAAESTDSAESPEATQQGVATPIHAATSHNAPLASQQERKNVVSAVTAENKKQNNALDETLVLGVVKDTDAHTTSGSEPQSQRTNLKATTKAHIAIEGRREPKNPYAFDKTRPAFDTGSFAQVPWTPPQRPAASETVPSASATPSAPSTQSGSARVAEPGVQESGYQGRHGKRRQDEHSQAISVADLLKRKAQENSKDNS
ncbi:hypothetical protein FQV43_01455 [Corynebacterium sp. sy039]|nr:DUF6779 domain-containing protein [Corynebacterium sp. sy039]QDZ41980.1 hypothetical protein FQV43_01455 [Corynebacterium sp. sy039]